MEFPIGGKSPRAQKFAQDSVQLRDRQYSLDGRRLHMPLALWTGNFCLSMAAFSTCVFQMPCYDKTGHFYFAVSAVWWMLSADRKAGILFDDG